MTTTAPSDGSAATHAQAAAAAALAAGRSRVERVRIRLDAIADADADRSFPFTIVALVAFVLLGAVVVPLSIPDAPPAPSRAQALAERYLAAFAEPSSPAAAAKLPVPSLEQAVAEFGTTGGEACTGSDREVYDSLYDGASFDKAAYATTRVAQSVYCPDRVGEFTRYVNEQAADKRAARAAAAAAGAEAG